MKHLCEFEARTASLDQANDFLIAQLDRSRFGQAVLFDLRIAIEEVFTNIITHGLNRRQTDKISICLKLETESVQVEISDTGLAFDPLTVADPDLDISPADREPGGMGIYLVKQLMDEVSYRRLKGRNILTLRKNISDSRDNKE